MTPASVVLVLAAALSPQDRVPDWPTLGAVMDRHGVPTRDVADAAQQISSYDVASTEDWFAIAYYWSTAGGLLPKELRIRTFDRRTLQAGYAELDGPYGSIVRVVRHGEHIYVTGHETPSRAPTLVLTGELRVVRVLDGWISLPLSDGRVVYHRSMVHFAPVHPGSLGLYDPRDNTDRLLYPEAQTDSMAALDDMAVRAAMIDRRISRLEEQRDTRTITFEVVEQPRKWAADGPTAIPAGPERRLLVTCRVVGQPTCTAVAAPARQERGNRSLREPAAFRPYRVTLTDGPGRDVRPGRRYGLPKQ